MYWYEEEVQSLVLKKETLTVAPKTIFYGSSTIRLWVTLTEDFADLAPVNLGFGGSTLAACVWFFDRIVGPYTPERIIVYAGDNDLGDGRTPEEVFIFFQQLTEKVKQHFSTVPCYFISLKPSPARWTLNTSFEYTNKLIAEEIVENHKNWKFINIFPDMVGPDGEPMAKYYDTDGLHLSPAGYKLWKEIVSQHLA